MRSRRDIGWWLAMTCTAMLWMMPCSAWSAERARSVRVAVTRLDGLGLSQGVVENLAMLLRNSIATIPGFEVIAPAQIDIALRNPRNRAVASCGGGPDCMVKVGKLVGASRVVFGTIGALGQAYSLNLRLLDVGAGKELAREQANVSGNRDLLIPEVRLAAFKLLAPERIRGALRIEIDAEGVQVEVDGVDAGTTPLRAPIEGLSPGEHVVRLRRPGYAELQQTVVVRPFETTRLKVALAEEGAPSSPSGGIP